VRGGLSIRRPVITYRVECGEFAGGNCKRKERVDAGDVRGGIGVSVDAMPGEWKGRCVKHPESV
jgi:hypothetical protein